MRKIKPDRFLRKRSLKYRQRKLRFRQADFAANLSDTVSKYQTDGKEEIPRRHNTNAGQTART